MERKSSRISWEMIDHFCDNVKRRMPKITKYTAFTALFSIFSSPLDAGFMAQIISPVCAYAVNFVADIASELLIADFAAIQRLPRLTDKEDKDKKRWTKRQKLSLFMLVFAFLNVFFSWLFTWRTILANRPDLPPWVAFAAAFWTPLTVMGWGIGEAITKSAPRKVKSEPLPELSREAVRAWLVTRNGDKASVDDVIKHFEKTHTISKTPRTIRNWL